MLNTMIYRRMPLAITLLLAASLTAGQEAPQVASVPSETRAKPASIYRLDYAVYELQDGKRINARTYHISAKGVERPSSIGGRASLRIGSKVPIEMTASRSAGGTLSSSSGTVEYQDVGIKIDSFLDERGGDILLNTIFESSSIATPEKPTEERGNVSFTPPVIRRVSFTDDSLVNLGRPTVIATLDDVTTTRRFEIEVTVTKMK